MAVNGTFQARRDVQKPSRGGTMRKVLQLHGSQSALESQRSLDTTSVHIDSPSGQDGIFGEGPGIGTIST